MIYKMRKTRVCSLSLILMEERFKGGDKKAQRFNSAQVLQAIPLFSLPSFDQEEKW